MYNEGQGQEFKIAALARNRASLRSTVAYLHRRSISVQVVATLAELVELLASKKANVALLSVDFPHGRIEMIPPLLKQSFGVETIAFAEHPDRRTESRLSNPQFRHPIHGGISGLSVLMRIRKIEQEMNGPDGEEADEKAKSDDLDIHIHTDRIDNIPIHMKGDRPRARKDAMAQLMRALSDVGARTQASEEDVQDAMLDLGRKMTRAELQAAIAQGRLTPRRQDYSGRGGRRGRKPTWYESSELESHDRRAKHKKKPGAIEHDRLIAPNGGRAEAALHEPSEMLLMKCAREALQSLCGHVETSSATQMKLRFAALIGISSHGLRGAVICAIPFTQIFHGTVIQEFERAFLRSMEANGVPVQAGRCSVVHLDDLSIAEEALAGSKMVLSAKTDDRQMSIALVSGTSSPPILEAHDNMLKVRVHDIVHDSPVTFDVFLHMPANQKYLRYLKLGSRLSLQQKDKLLSKNVEHFYLTDKDVESFIRFYVTMALSKSRFSGH